MEDKQRIPLPNVVFVGDSATTIEEKIRREKESSYFAYVGRRMISGIF
jgi:hypothetical protein